MFEGSSMGSKSCLSAHAPMQQATHTHTYGDALRNINSFCSQFCGFPAVVQAVLCHWCKLHQSHLEDESLPWVSLHEHSFSSPPYRFILQTLQEWFYCSCQASLKRSTPATCQASSTLSYFHAQKENFILPSVAAQGIYQYPVMVPFISICT